MPNRPIIAKPQQIAGATVVITSKPSASRGSPKDSYEVSFDGDAQSITAAKQLLIDQLKNNSHAHHHTDTGNVITFTNNGFNPDGSDQHLTKTRSMAIYEAMKEVSRLVPSKEALENSLRPAQEGETEYEIGGEKLFVGSVTIPSYMDSTVEKHFIRFANPDSEEAQFLRRKISEKLTDMGVISKNSLDDNFGIHFQADTGTNRIPQPGEPTTYVNADHLREVMKDLKEAYPEHDLLDLAMTMEANKGAIRREKGQLSEASKAAEHRIDALDIRSRIHKTAAECTSVFGGNIHLGGESGDEFLGRLEENIRTALMEEMAEKPTLATAVNRAHSQNNARTGR